jgi:hypothetical protein
MAELLTLNVFAESLGAALIGICLFGGLVALPLFIADDAWPRKCDVRGAQPC